MARLGKKKSKRVSTRTRCKIEKKVREHNRKLAKKAKNTSKRKKKDPGVPNSFPYKEQVLKEAEERKRTLEEERVRQKERRKNEREKLQNKKRSLGGLVKDAEKRAQQFAQTEKVGQGEKLKEHNAGKTPDNSLKAYYKEFKKVVAASDVIIQVLDARDPLGSRCSQVEQAVLASGSQKRLVLLLNKIDLVPKENVEEWLKYLRNEFPTVAFKASTQEQADRLSQSRVAIAKASDDLRQSSRCLGADMLMKLLGNYCRNKDIKTSITVGVVGFPNTGKSSVINSLKRSKACGTGAMPGVTKTMQTVQLDKHVRLLDSPGIVMATGSTDAQLILRNCVKVETVEDPTAAVEAILRRCNKEKMMLQYNIANYADITEFLVLLATRLGRLKKGGVPHTTKAARAVLQDWNNGKIRYYTEPPEHNDTHVAADIVTEMSKEFDIMALINDEYKTLKDLKSISTKDMQVDSLGPANVLDENAPEVSDNEEMGTDDSADEEEDDDVDTDEEMEELEEENKDPKELKDVVVTAGDNKTRSRKNSTSKDPKKSSEKMDVEMTLQGNQQLAKQLKKNVKKLKKNRKRADALGGKLSDALEGAFASLGGSSTNDDYDFSEHFDG